MMMTSFSGTELAFPFWFHKNIICHLVVFVVIAIVMAVDKRFSLRQLTLTKTSASKWLKRLLLWKYFFRTPLYRSVSIRWVRPTTVRKWLLTKSAIFRDFLAANIYFCQSWSVMHINIMADWVRFFYEKGCRGFDREDGSVLGHAKDKRSILA